MKIGDIANVKALMDKQKGGSDVLKLMHRICYGGQGKATQQKANIRAFSGLMYTEDGAGTKEKKEAILDKTKGADLKALANVCEISPAGTKAELMERLLSWFESPSESGKKDIGEMRKEKKAKVARKKVRAENKRKKGKKAKAKKTGPKKAPSSYFLYVASVRAEVTTANKDKKVTELSSIFGGMWKAVSDEEKAKWKAKSAALQAAMAPTAAEEDSDSDSDSDDSESESEEAEEAKPKKKAKKAKKAKPPPAESDSDDDIPLGNFGKPKVTRDSLTEQVKTIASGPDFEGMTLRGIREKLGEFYSLAKEDMDQVIPAAVPAAAVPAAAVPAVDCCCWLLLLVAAAGLLLFLLLIVLVNPQHKALVKQVVQEVLAANA